jgi:hypothetical protein
MCTVPWWVGFRTYHYWSLYLLHSIAQLLFPGMSKAPLNCQNSRCSNIDVKSNSLDGIMYMGTLSTFVTIRYCSFFTVVICDSQVSQLGAAAQKYQAATQNASSNLSVPELQNNCNM